MDSAQVGELAPVFGDLRQSEKLSVIKPVLIQNFFQPLVLYGSMGVIVAAQQDFVCKWDSLHLKL